MVSLLILINRVLDALLGPLSGLHPLVPLSLWSVVVGVVAMLIYKYTSKQSGIKDAKDRIKGHFFEVWIYIADAPVIARAQARIMWNAGRYLSYALVPLAIMIVLFFPLFANFETRYAFGPAPVGEPVLVEVRLTDQFDGWRDAVKLEAPAGVKVVGSPVRFIRKIMDEDNVYKELGRDYVVDYKLAAERPGSFDLKFTAKGESVTVPFVAGDKPGVRAPPYQASDLATALLFPPEVKISSASGIDHVRINYPEAEFPFLGWNTWWVWPFLIVSMIAAYSVKGVLKVEI